MVSTTRVSAVAPVFHGPGYATTYWGSCSRTRQGVSCLANSKAAVSPAGPAPQMTTDRVARFPSAKGNSDFTVSIILAILATRLGTPNHMQVTGWDRLGSGLVHPMRALLT